jgi:hypothetical protein
LVKESPAVSLDAALFFVIFYYFIYILNFFPSSLMRNLSLVAALMLLALVSHAQPSSGGPTPAPIDGGISVLLAGGAAYAVRRLRRRKA